MKYCITIEQFHEMSEENRKKLKDVIFKKDNGLENSNFARSDELLCVCLNVNMLIEIIRSICPEDNLSIETFGWTPEKITGWTVDLIRKQDDFSVEIEGELVDALWNLIKEIIYLV